MQNSIFLRFGVGIVLAALLVAGVLFLRPLAGKPSSSNQTASTTVTNLGNGTAVVTTGDVTIKEVTDSSTPTPSLTKPFVFSPTLSADVVTALRAKEEDLTAKLKKDPSQAENWLLLGVYRKMAGDYQGAAEVWTYVAHNAPGIDYVAYGNLGDLYMNFLKDYAKAEANYKAAIAIKPDFVDYYRELFTYYHLVLKDDTKAAAIVQQGLKANPDNKDLLALQAQLKK